MTLSIADKKFLIVDDEAFMLRLIARILKNMGGDDPLTAKNGQDALDVLDGEGKPVDVILLDLNMPGMDGVEFLRHLSERSFGGGIVLVSGEDKRVLKTAENLAQAHRLSILGSVSKPLTPESLLPLLEKLAETGIRTQHKAAKPVTEDDLRQGIKGDELIVFYQPQVSVKTRELVGVESLVRWQHTTLGMVPPDAFIPVAERCGLIDDLTDAVFAKAMRQAGAWEAEGLSIKVAVNISVNSLNRLDLPEFIISTAEGEGVNPANLVLEVTESRLMKDIVTPLEILTRLRLKGIGLSIDDFGTGYSSMEQLKRIPFTELKIDRAFVNGAVRDRAARAILESSVDLAKKLDMTIVAEGVEDRDDWALIESLDVDIMQGFFVAKPMPGHEILLWLKEWTIEAGGDRPAG